MQNRSFKQCKSQDFRAATLFLEKCEAKVRNHWWKGFQKCVNLHKEILKRKRSEKEELMKRVWEILDGGEEKVMGEK